MTGLVYLATKGWAKVTGDNAKAANKAALWLGIVTSVIAVLAFFGIKDFDSLQKAVEAEDSTALRDPCEALSSDYVQRLGKGLRLRHFHEGRSFSKDAPNNGESWECVWLSAENEIRLFISYDQESYYTEEGNRALDGIPNGRIGEQSSRYIGVCFAGWPTSFGEALVYYSGTCSETEVIAKDAYKNLSR
ncbi:hypothetical protein ACFPA8_27535 [Streptomyces ovatisporus]|uniref:Secreted protein n=1 Tax=Streptomyces ovatisporus TaxID=1128682 RepID=A0ABV9AGE5_9ACTN